MVSGLVRCSFVLRPARSLTPLNRSLLHQGLRTFHCFHARLDCYRLERKLPGGFLNSPTGVLRLSTAHKHGRAYRGVFSPKTSLRGGSFHRWRRRVWSRSGKGMGKSRLAGRAESSCECCPPPPGRDCTRPSASQTRGKWRHHAIHELVERFKQFLALIHQARYFSASGLSAFRSFGRNRPFLRISSPSNQISPPPHSGRWISTISQCTADRFPLSHSS